MMVSGRGKVSTSEAMVDHAQQTSRGERVSAKTKNEVTGGLLKRHGKQ